MTKKEAQEFRQRWQLAESVQQAERRCLSFDEKCQQLDQCYQAALELGLLKRYAAARRKGEREVQQRWRRLKGLAA